MIVIVLVLQFHTPKIIIDNKKEEVETLMDLIDTLNHNINVYARHVDELNARVVALELF